MKQRENKGLSEYMIVEGCVDSIIFRNTENGYTILRLSVQGEKETTTCVGNLSYVGEGDYLRCEGDLTKHQLYGMQLHVSAGLINQVD